MKFKFLLLLGCLAFCGQMLYAQIDTLREQGKGSNHQPGNIQGLVFDADTQTPIAGATVKLLSDGRTTSTDAQGQFRIPVVSPGSHFLQISYVGYEQIKDLPVNVYPAQTSEISSSLKKAGNHMEEVVITSTSGGSGEDRLIRERQAAMMAQVQIGAQELSRKGISDASDAVAQLAGISQQEGHRTVFIRGLGDRYRTTSLNHLPLPSDDPEHKNPSLTLFSTDVVDAIEVDKTYHSTLSGDFGGGHVRIQSKKFPVQNYWNPLNKPSMLFHMPHIFPLQPGPLLSVANRPLLRFRRILFNLFNSARDRTSLSSICPLVCV
jgi:hypothetical protein